MDNVLYPCLVRVYLCSIVAVNIAAVCHHAGNVASAMMTHRREN